MAGLSYGKRMVCIKLMAYHCKTITTYTFLERSDHIEFKYVTFITIASILTSKIAEIRIVIVTTVLYIYCHSVFSQYLRQIKYQMLVVVHPQSAENVSLTFSTIFYKYMIQQYFTVTAPHSVFSQYLKQIKYQMLVLVHPQSDENVRLRYILQIYHPALFYCTI